MLTKLEIWQKVYDGLEAQNWVRSVKPGTDTCVYRTSTGLGCAIGVLLPPDVGEGTASVGGEGNHYVIAPRGGVWATPERSFGVGTRAPAENARVAAELNKLGVPATDDMARFLSDLQKGHDGASGNGEPLRTRILNLKPQENQ